MKSKIMNVVVSGSYGRTNSGDEAILFSIIKQLRSIKKNINITIISLNPKETRKQYNVNSIYTFNILDINKALKKCDVFISGGGTLLQNITSTRSIVYYLYVIRQAKKYNCKVIMYGCGIGPIKGKIIRKLCNIIINNYVDDVLLRDTLSYNELKHLNVDLSKVDIGIDPSLLLKKYIKKDEDILKNFNLNNNEKYVAICVKKSNNSIVLDEMIKIINYLYKEGIIPVLIPMDYKEDLDVSKELGNKISTPYYIIDKYISFSSKYNLISHMQLVIGMRLHAILFAYLSNIKVIGISYDQKINSFCKDYGITNIININEFSYNRFIKEYSCLKQQKVNSKKINKLGKKNVELLKKYIK